MSLVGKHTFQKASLERKGWAEGRVPQAPRDEGAVVAAQALCKPCVGKHYVTAESRPPVTPGQPHPQELRHKAGTHRLIRGDSKRPSGAPIPLPPSALLRWLWEVFLGSFSSAVPAKACFFTGRQTFNEGPSVVGVIILVLQELPSLFVINTGWGVPSTKNYHKKSQP